MTGRHSLAFSTVAAALIALAGCAGAATPTAPSGAATQPAFSASPETSQAFTTRYRVSFDGTWSASTHPSDFPSNPHFSPLVGATHAAATRFWTEGAAASPGIRTMAETGGTSPLSTEIQAAIAADAAEYLLLGSGIGRAPGAVSLEFDITQSHPFVTLVSMIAPSPDWFVGVSGVALFVGGRWVDQRRLELTPWDAGTDSGSTFTSADRVTTPPQPVSRILSAPLAPGGRVAPLGTFTFTRLQ